MKVKALAWCLPVFLLAACQSGTPEATTDTSCDQSKIEYTIDMFLHESNLHVTSLNALKCAPNWAYAQATVADEQGVVTQEAYVFQEVEQNWILKAPEGVCGSSNGDGERPTDSLVPEELWSDACASSGN